MGKIKNLLDDELMKDMTEDSFRNIMLTNEKEQLYKKYVRHISIVKQHIENDHFESDPFPIERYLNAKDYLHLLEYGLIGLNLHQQQDKIINILTRK